MACRGATKPAVKERNSGVLYHGLKGALAHFRMILFVRSGHVVPWTHK